ncbi:ribosomal L7Ae/L30e/S12e/Gadd45 family protein [Cellulosilyticum sp. ST5]|nr:ribosomal L7Ae/L30e/S12e/Gadd45 family protein [Cellulosilyticum lentocellum]
MHKNEPKGGFMLYDLENTIQIVGTKQTIKHLEKGDAKVVFVAKDADDRVTGQVVELAKAKNVQVEFVDTMKELGEKCNIEVKTAVAAIIA